MHGRLGLSDAHRLDEDDVEAGGFAQHDRLARLARHAAERPGRGRGADEDVGVVTDALHAGLVAEDRASAALRRGVDGQHRELVAQRGDHVAHGLDEGRFAGSRDARDADAHRMPGVGQAALDDLLRLGVVGRIGRLDERDGLREGGDVAREDALDVLVGRERALAAPREVGAYDRLVPDAFRDVERRVVVRVRILLFVVVYLRE